MKLRLRRKAEQGPAKEKGPSFLERQRAARPWLDHLVRTGVRYQGQRGDFYAAGITYFTVLAIFPLLMVAFSVAGFVLVRDPQLLDRIRDEITGSLPDSMASTVKDLIDTAINSRATVGVIGLLGAAYSGLGWMANLRAALTEQWEQKSSKSNFLLTKVHDLGALLGLTLAMMVSLGISVLGSGSLGQRVIGWLGLSDLPGIGAALTAITVLAGIGASWAVFVWVIARLPRESVGLRSAMRGALIAAVAFEIFKRVAVLYLEKVMSGPAGVAFGPIIGLMVFANITARIVLLATAFAATSKESLALATVPAPDPVIIEQRVQVREGSGPAGVAFGLLLGALAVLGLGRLAERLRRS
ncbi:inner membrane protein YhjD [Tomitella biformata]|uniref:inner membrane protein YhjD n=1 Tax=Tomitella biformata TaxID=630403 RepID=UPI000688EEDC|nr:inner membrane protein YhjD [Tomitella biformata]